MAVVALGATVTARRVAVSDRGGVMVKVMTAGAVMAGNQGKVMPVVAMTLLLGEAEEAGQVVLAEVLARAGRGAHGEHRTIKAQRAATG